MQLKVNRREQGLGQVSWPFFNRRKVGNDTKTQKQLVSTRKL